MQPTTLYLILTLDKVVTYSVLIKIYNCYGNYREYLDLFHEAVIEGKISKNRLDDAVTRIIYAKLKLGLFETPMYPLDQYPDFGSKEFQATAKQAALESITLLKNDKQTLPLKKDEKILLLGAVADNLIFQNGSWTHTWQGMDSSFNSQNLSGKTNKNDAIDSQWPFGLSYTSYTYSNLTLSKTSMVGENDSIIAKITVSNNGKIAGKEVVQWFITDEYASISPANKKLKQFEKIDLLPNQTKTIKFVIHPSNLKFVGENNEWILEKGIFIISIENFKNNFRLD
jgi:hypothetical protein